MVRPTGQSKKTIVHVATGAGRAALGVLALHGSENGKLEVELLRGQESFRINSFTKSNVWAVLPGGQSKFKKGQIIDCFLPNQSNII